MTNSTPEVPADEEIVDAEIVTDPMPTPPTTPAVGAPPTAEPSAAPAFPVPVPAFDYTDDGVPTLDYLRDKVEGRLGRAGASAELAEAAKVRSDQERASREAQRQLEAEQARNLRDRAAEDRLAAIRRSLHPDS